LVSRSERVATASRNVPYNTFYPPNPREPNVDKLTELTYLGFAEKVFRWWQGVGCGVWGVGFYSFSGGQLPNFQGKSPGILPPITPMLGTFEVKKA
jgi:hypothetical protein